MSDELPYTALSDVHVRDELIMRIRFVVSACHHIIGAVSQDSCVSISMDADSVIRGGDGVYL